MQRAGFFLEVNKLRVCDIRYFRVSKSKARQKFFFSQNLFCSFPGQLARSLFYIKTKVNEYKSCGELSLPLV